MMLHPERVEPFDSPPENYLPRLQGSDINMNKPDGRIDPGRSRYLQQKGDVEASLRDSRWCARHGYFIDLAACEARAKTRPSCGRCIARWRQLSFSFMES